MIDHYGPNDERYFKFFDYSEGISRVEVGPKLTRENIFADPYCTLIHRLHIHLVNFVKERKID